MGVNNDVKEAIKIINTNVNPEPSCWDRCVSSKWNPKNWDVTTEEVAKVAAIILTACVMITVMSALMINFAEARGALFGLCAVGGAASLIALIIALVKQCQKNKTTAVEVGGMKFSVENAK